MKKAAAGLRSTAAAFESSRKLRSICLAVSLADYFAAAAGFLALAAGLAEDLATTGTMVARRRRFLSRFLAVARLRVFSRALSFGIGGAPWFRSSAPDLNVPRESGV
jgi:hypothetical protein